MSKTKAPQPEAQATEPAPEPRGLAGRTIAVGNIEPSATNPRKTFDKAKLEELAASIKARGVLQPILVRPLYETTRGIKLFADVFWKSPTPGEIGQMRFELVAGERRWRAAQAAGLAEIPATILDLTDKDVCDIQIIENEQRDDLSPLEKASGYKQAIDVHGYTVEALAAKVGKSVATIYGLLKLIDLPKEAQKAVENGQLAMTTAQLIARLPSKESRKEMLDWMTNGIGFDDPPSFRDVKWEIEHRYMVELKAAPFSTKDAALAPAAGSCEACPKRTGNDRANYPDARADVCTDPECYRDKVKLNTARVAALAREKGQKVLEGKEAQSALGYSSSYYDLKSRCYEDAKRKTYKQLLGADLKEQTVIAVDDRGTVHELVPKKEAKALLKSKHKISQGSYDASGDTSWRKAEAKRKKDSALRAKAGALAIAQIVDVIEKGNLVELLHVIPLLVRETAGEVWHDTRRLVLKRRGIESKQGDGTREEKALMKCAESMGVTQAFALIAELVMTKTLCEHHSYSTGKSAERDAILKAFGLDWKNLMKEAAEGKAKPAVDESKRPKSELKPPNGESNGHNNGTKAAKNGTGQSGAAVHFPDDPIAQARTHGAPALRPLRDLPLSSHVKQRALPALERYNIVSPQHCVNRMTNLGADMVYALKSIPGVSEENAAAITAAIAKLDLPVTVIIKDGRLPGQREEAMQGV